MARRYKKREESLIPRNLNNALSKVNFRWEEIGTELNIPPAAINNIDRNKRGNVNMCTLGLIDHWLRTDIEATWEKLAQALENLNENNVAADIREKYIPDSISGSGSGSGSSSMGTSSGSGGSHPRIASDSTPVNGQHNQEENDIRHIHVLIGNNQEEDKLQKIVNLYSEGGAKFDDVDDQGCTLVHHCAKQGDLEAMKAFVALGADINMMDTHHFTSYDAARYLQKNELADFLKEVGGLDGHVLACMEQSPQSKRPRRSLEEEEEMLRGLRMGSDSESGVPDDQLILSLDSSSTMAVLQLEYLNQLEKITGRQVTDLFSWIVASGVGGFLMLAMVYCDFDLDKLRRLYFRLRNRVFCGLEQKQRIGALKEFALEIFQYKKMNSVQSRMNLLIGAVNKESTVLQSKFFNNYNHQSTEEATMHVWEVACYTCSTPLYIGEYDQYIDGGAISKNPSIFALGQIMEHCRAFGTSVGGLVSLGDGQVPALPLKKLDSSNLDVFTLSTRNALTKEISDSCSRLCKTLGQRYYRFDPLLTIDEYVHQPEEISLQKLVSALLRTITQCQNDEDLKDFGRKFS